MNNKTLPKVTLGMTVFALHSGCRARYSGGDLQECVVSKIGRKYFTIKRVNTDYEWIGEFTIDGWLEKDYDSAHRTTLYLSRQQCADEREHARLLTELRKAFDFHGQARTLSLDQLKAVSLILKGSQDGNQHQNT